MSQTFGKFALVSTVLLVALTAIYQTYTPSDSGIYGTATIGPTCPVQRSSDTSCDDRQYQATLDVYLYDANKPVIMIYPPVYGTGRKVTTFTTGPDGKFRLRLTSGDYVIRKAGSTTPPSLYEKKVTVITHNFTEVNLQFDSGIR